MPFGCFWAMCDEYRVFYNAYNPSKVISVCVFFWEFLFVQTTFFFGTSSNQFLMQTLHHIPWIIYAVCPVTVVHYINQKKCTLRNLKTNFLAEFQLISLNANVHFITCTKFNCCLFYSYSADTQHFMYVCIGILRN